MLQQLHFQSPRARRARLGVTAAAVALVVAACGGGDDDVVSPSCSTQVNDTQEKLQACVTVDGVKAHLTEFDKIAKANNGNRESGSAGFNASADYAVTVFTAAGYTVSRKEFTFVAFTDNGGSVLQQTAPAPVADIAHAVMSYSGSGDVTGVVTVAANQGCDASDFAGFPANGIALVVRGTCTFQAKATNAIAAGAIGVVIYNNTDGDLNGTLGDTFTADVPVLSVTQALGTQLAATAGLSLRLKADTVRDSNTTYNIIADSVGGDANSVVMVGAHLDSVAEGAGINDNGTGSAAILEIARQLAKVTPKNRLRFALWGGEESGLLGSTNYVESLTDEERGKIALYLNFDMIGSPNAGYFIYDGDNSDNTGEGPGPVGSDAIEKTFEAFYTAHGKAFKGTDFDGRSDYGPFIENGIPAGGLFTGAEDLKTADEVTLWGGTAGVAYDKCYHSACDDLTNLDLAALDLNADAVAYATLQYAFSLDGVVAARERAGPLAVSTYKAPADMRPKHLPKIK